MVEIKKEQEQEVVKNWFDNTYSKRAKQYLRPVDAYHIYLSLLEAQDTGSILDVACGIGQMLKVADNTQRQLYGIDISEVAIEIAKEDIPHAHLTTGNVESLPYENDKFDYVTCLGSLERFLNLEIALSEINRVCKPTAKICFLVRNSKRPSWIFIKEKLGIINKKGHQGAKSKAQWEEIFKNQNFKIVRVHHDQWPSTRWKRWLSLKGKLFNVNYSKILSTNTSIEEAYEFVFILSKNR